MDAAELPTEVNMSSRLRIAPAVRQGMVSWYVSVQPAEGLDTKGKVTVACQIRL